MPLILAIALMGMLDTAGAPTQPNIIQWVPPVTIVTYMYAPAMMGAVATTTTTIITGYYWISQGAKGHDLVHVRP